MTPENTYYTARRGWNEHVCRACQREHRRKSYQNKTTEQRREENRKREERLQSNPERRAARNARRRERYANLTAEQKAAKVEAARKWAEANPQKARQSKAKSASKSLRSETPERRAARLARRRLAEERRRRRMGVKPLAEHLALLHQNRGQRLKESERSKKSPIPFAVRQLWNNAAPNSAIRRRFPSPQDMLKAGIGYDTMTDMITFSTQEDDGDRAFAESTY